MNRAGGGCSSPICSAADGTAPPPPPVPARPQQQPAPYSSSIGQNHPFYFGQQQPLVPYGSGAGGMYQYHHYQQTPSFANPWSSAAASGGQTAGGTFPGADYNNFLRLAEDSSRNAFQSVESVVSAFVSMANMLNSTHAAVFSTFRAVAGVIEQFRSLKHFLLSSVLFSLARWLRFLWRRCLAMLRLRPRNYANSEAIWTSIQQEGGANPRRSVNCASLLFWLITLGGPFLIYRCIVQIAQSAAEARKWTEGRGEHYKAQALYDFNTSTNGELSFTAFDVLRIAPKNEQPNIKDWLLASTFDGSKIGLIPINYIKLIGKCSGSPIQTAMTMN